MSRPKKWGGRRVAQERQRMIRAGQTTCHLCGEPIDTALKYPDPMSFSIDHRAPRSKGGRNTRSNYAPAHKRCNESRGNREIPEKVAATPLPVSKEWL